MLFFKALQKELCVHDTALHLDCNGVHVELCVCMRAQSLQSCPTLQPHGLAHEAPLSMGFSKRVY